MNIFRKYWEILSGFRYKGFLGICLILISGLSEGLALLFLIPILDGSFSHQNKVYETIFRNFIIGANNKSDIIKVSLGIFISLGLFSALFRLFSDGFLLKLRTKIEKTYREQMSQSLIKMNWVYFLSLKTGDISKSLIFEGYNIGWGSQAFLQGIGFFLICFIFATSAFFLSIRMAIFTVIFGLLGGILYYLSSKPAKKHSDELTKISGNLGGKANEVFSNLKFIRASNQSECVEKELGDVYLKYESRFFWSQIYNNLMRFLFESGAILFIGSFLFFNLFVNKASASSSLVFLAIFYRLMPRLLALQDSFFQAKINLSWYEEWKKRFIKANDKQEIFKGTKLPSFNRKLELIEVSFSYPNSKKNTLSNVSIEILPGQFIAIVGASGSGKSTLLDLITGLLKPDSGRILIDDIPLAEINIKKWRERLAIILQETPIFHATISENIAWNSDKIDAVKAKEVAEITHSMEFIERMEKGFNTVVGEKGGRLSGGQKQRLAFARALYKDPWLLILDEPTSALDIYSESIIQKTLAKMKSRCTTIMVSHNLRSISMADKIYVLDQGKIVEEGRWDDLVNKFGSKLRDLAHHQNLIAS